MKRWIRSGLCGACLLVGSTAVAQAGSAAMGGGARGVSVEDVKASVEVPRDEKAFLERLHHINQHEIRLGTLAQQKATLASVKSFAQMMVTEHRQADDRVMAYARTKKLTLGEPRPLSDRERKVMDASRANDEALQSMQGVAFDQAFMVTMVGGHDKALNKLVVAQQQFGSGEMGSLISELLPRIAQHRDHAARILSEVKAPVEPMGTGGAGTSGATEKPGKTY